MDKLFYLFPICFYLLQKKKGKKDKEKKVAATYDIPTPEGEKKGKND